MKRFSFISLTVFFLFILTACTDDSSVDEETGSSDTGAEEHGGDMTIAIPSDIVSLDPHGSNDDPSEQIRDTIYEPLVTHDEDLNIVPALAEEYEQIDDTTWSFKLREGVKFHDGSDFNADAVKANIERIQDPARASARSSLLDMVSEVNIIDDYNIELVTEYPYAPLLNNLSHGAGKMISKELIDADYENALEQADSDLSLEEYYELRTAGGDDYDAAVEDISQFVGEMVETGPVGTNYFKFESRSPGEETAVSRNDDYWDTPALLESITFKVVTEPGTRIAELESGSSDAILSTLTSNTDRIEETDGMTLMRSDAVNVDYTGFNTSKEPFDDPKIRQAISHAFDSEAVLDGVYNGSGIPANGPLAPALLGYSEELQGLEYDMERAEQLLAEAGAEDLTINLMVNDDNPERLDAALWLQESLNEIGVTLNVEQVEWGAYLDATGNAEHDMFILGWGNTTGDPDETITSLYHTENHGNNGNRSFYSNSELDSLLDDARQETDEDTRETMYIDAQEIIIEEAPSIFIRHGEYLNAYNDNVHEFKANGFNMLDFSETYIDSE